MRRRLSVLIRGLTAPFVCVGKKRVGQFLTASSIKTSNTTRPCVTRHSTIPPLQRGQVVSVNAVTLGLNKDDALNFGGQQQELWCEGGEVAFIKKMIEESKGFAKQVMWFTSLVSRGENLPPLYRALTDVGAVKVVKKRWPGGKSRVALLHWTFMNDEQRRRFVNRQR